MHVRTPCVGLCSTTFGDLVCRGCKRWAPEIVGWNGFDDAQKAIVVSRLETLRAGSVAAHVSIVDRARLLERATGRGLDAAHVAAGDARIVMELLRQDIALADMGCRAIGANAADRRALFAVLDQEWLERSRAALEQSTRQVVSA